MYERFTERARQVVILAQDEAHALKHNFVGTEHLLLGLIREEEGIAARVLTELGFDCDLVRGRVIELAGVGEEAATGQVPMTPTAKKVCELALREALSLGHNYVGTEHLLLGLLREPSGLGYRITVETGIDIPTIQQEILRTLNAGAKKRKLEGQKVSKPVVKQTVTTSVASGGGSGTVVSFAGTISPPTKDQILDKVIDLFKWFRDNGFQPVTLTSYGVGGALRINLDADHVWKHAQISEISERVAEAGCEIEFSRKHGMTIREKRPFFLTSGMTSGTNTIT